MYRSKLLLFDRLVGAREAASRDRHHQGNWPGWIGLRPCKLRDSLDRGSARCRMQKATAGKFHGIPQTCSRIFATRNGQLRNQTILAAKFTRKVA